jgi:hypothetical protein
MGHVASEIHPRGGHQGRDAEQEDSGIQAYSEARGMRTVLCPLPSTCRAELRIWG